MSRTVELFSPSDRQVSSEPHGAPHSSVPLPIIYCNSVEAWSDNIRATTSSRELGTNLPFWALDKGPIAIGQTIRRVGYAYRPDHPDMRWALHETPSGSIDLQLQHASHYHRVSGHFWYSSAGITAAHVPSQIPPISDMSPPDRAHHIAVWLEEHLKDMAQSCVRHHEMAKVEADSLTRSFGPEDLQVHDHNQALRLSGILTPDQLRYCNGSPQIDAVLLYKAGTGKDLGRFDGGPIIVGMTSAQQPPTGIGQSAAGSETFAVQDRSFSTSANHEKTTDSSGNA